MPKRWDYGLLVTVFVSVLSGCTAPPLYSYLVYENPTSFVRLEFSPWADTEFPETWNAHPTTLSRQQIDKALRGLRVREHRSAPIKWVRGLAAMAPVFREENPVSHPRPFPSVSLLLTSHFSLVRRTPVNRTVP